MNTPLVSIIIPTYNRAHLIGETLDSVLAQSYTNWECVVVDDGSNDTTAQLMAEYCAKDSRFKYHHRPKERAKGANACRNYGFELSKGAYIQWFDSDDLMHPRKMELKIKYSLENKADVVVDTHTTRHDVSLPLNPKLELFESSEFYIDYILGKKPVITNDVMVKKNIVGECRFDEKLHKAQEYEFLTRLFEQRLTYLFVDLPLSFYRESQDSISKNTSRGNVKQVESLIYLSKLLIARHAENPLIVTRGERQGRKTYKSLAKRRNIKMLFKHFNFFRKAHHKSFFVFGGYLIYNLISGRGFDAIKPK